MTSFSVLPPEGHEFYFGDKKWIVTEYRFTQFGTLEIVCEEIINCVKESKEILEQINFVGV